MSTENFNLTECMKKRVCCLFQNPKKGITIAWIMSLVSMSKCTQIRRGCIQMSAFSYSPQDPSEICLLHVLFPHVLLHFQIGIRFSRFHRSLRRCKYVKAHCWRRNISCFCGCVDFLATDSSFDNGNHHNEKIQIFASYRLLPGGHFHHDEPDAHSVRHLRRPCK